jgi:hypothetical protein
MPKYSILQGLRIIALTLDYPEVNFDPTTGTFTTTLPGTVVHVTPTLSDLYGGGRSLSYHLYYCLDPGVGLGATPTCDGNPTKTDVSSASFVAPSGTFTAPNYTGSTNLPQFDIDFSLLTPSVKSLYIARFNSLTPAQRFNGYSILVFFELYPTGDPTTPISTFKRLIFSDSSKPVKNKNPGALDFQISGISISSLPIQESLVNAYVAPTEFETYSLKNTDGSLQTLTESIETTWFLTGPEDIACSKKKECSPDGIFELTRSTPGELNRFTPPTVASPTSRGRILIGVAKDDRGGNTVKRICDGAAGLCP